jgi:hypothetical protein
LRVDCDNDSPMSDVISEYQKWKVQGENLRTEAQQAMASRFRDLLAEAVRIAEEYRADFGAPLKPPPPVTAFRFKASAKPKAKKSAKPKPAAKPVETRPEPKAAAKPDPKVAALQKRIAATKKKLEDAKAAGTPTRTLEDKIYELEDDLRLATQPV